jgi:hypothetical protein
VLGIQVQFVIDAGDGIIDMAEGQPSVVSIDKRLAIATTFDTEDNAGNAIHQDIAKPVVEPDECQAWVRISNSLRTVVNVTVMFPPPPPPIPAEVRLTALTCGTSGQATIKNPRRGPCRSPAWSAQRLGYFAVRRAPRPRWALAPGESKTFGIKGLAVRPGHGRLRQRTSDYGWWNGTISRITCAGVTAKATVPQPPAGRRRGHLPRDRELPSPNPPARAGLNLVTGRHFVDIATALGDNANLRERANVGRGNT